MKIVQKKLDSNIIQPFYEYLPYFHKALFLDIETTGFHRERDSIFLLGLIEVKDESYFFTQYFCEKESDEYELLFRFNELLRDYDVLFHFNGNNFDLPFLLKRMSLYRISERITQLQSYDFLKAIRPLKKILNTDNLKLSSLEKIAGFDRHDPFQGGDLILLYKAFLEGDDQVLPSILLHNEEDLYGLLYLLVFVPILQCLSPLPNSTKPNMLSDTPKIHSIETSMIEAELSFSSPFPVYTFSRKEEEFSIQVSSQGIVLHLPLYYGELKYFFEDYSNYYYLPLEDYAIHHSLATFVDKRNRKKASKETAYIRKEGTFIRYPLLAFRQDKPALPLFRQSQKDSFVYFLKEDFLQLKAFFQQKMLTDLAIFLIKESKIG
ncbi:MAG: ribonuclease H-like domain-containing protein [Vallitaleaceae bacterium]|nr:ribonuclease H-like domain-containing protein [Vallitaleaceae bacterium]